MKNAKAIITIAEEPGRLKPVLTLGNQDLDKIIFALESWNSGDLELAQRIRTALVGTVRGKQYG